MNRHRRRASKGQTLGAENPGVGKVLTMEGSDVPLPFDATIDLVTAGKKFADGVPKFHVRDADPMRPFTHAERVAGPAIEIEQIFKDATPEERLPLLVGATKDFDLTKPLSKLDPMRQFVASRAMGLEVKEPDLGIRRMLDGEQGITVEKAKNIREELLAMGKNPVLARVHESAFHKVITAWRERTILIPAGDDGKPIIKYSDVGKIAEVLAEAQPSIFLLQHDWANAFAKATDFHGGEIALPYQICIFECRINGVRVAMMLAEEESPTNASDLPNVSLFAELKIGWAWCGSVEYDRDTFAIAGHKSSLFAGLDPLAEKLLAQVRAVCICLEAQVAETEVIRAPYKLNQKRERQGKLPLFDYHVVSLSARKHHAPRLPEAGDIEKERHHKRLHWVRGHWRHYENIKTWIRWHLRGDPDLGFVDKEYRL